MKNMLPDLLIAMTLLSCAGTSNAAEVELSDACSVLRSPQSNFELRTSFEVIDGRIYLPVLVNRKGPFRFAVDTGASGMARADSRLVSALGLKINGQRSNSDGIVTARSSTTHIDSIDLGGLVQHDLEVITRDYSSGKSLEVAFDGIIGRDFFTGGLLILDYPNRLLSFSRKLSISASNSGALAYDRPFRVPVSIGDLQTTGHLDTGANATLVLPRSLYDKVSSEPLADAGRGELSNVKIDTYRAIIHGPIQIGNLSLSDVEARVSGRFPELLIGAHALQGMALVIDQRSMTVALCKELVTFGS